MSAPLNALEGVEAEVGRLLLRAFHAPCQSPERCGCPGLYRVVGSAPELELDRWALMADVGCYPSSEKLAEAWEAEPDQQEHGVRFVAAFGVCWRHLDVRIMDGHARLWATPEIRYWMTDEEHGTPCELLRLRRFTGDRPSQAGAALVTMHDYRRCVQ